MPDSWRSMPARRMRRDARDPQLSHVYPLGSRVTEARASRARRLRRRRAGARVRHARLRRRRGRRPRARPGLRRAPTRPAARTSRSTSPPRPSRAPRSCASCARRAWRATSPPAASWRIALKAGFDPARIHLHGNAKSEAELRRGAWRPASATSSSTTTPTSTASSGLVPDGATAARAAARRARASAPTPTRRSPPAARTRSSASACSRRARRDRAPRRLRPARARGPAPAHRLADLRRRAASAPRSRRWPALGQLTAWSTSAAASASPTSTPSTRRRSRSTSRPRSTRCATSWARSADPRRAGPRARGQLDASPSTRCSRIKRNVDLYVAVDGGMSDNLRPMLYGARYEAQIASRFGGGTYCHLVGKHCESGDLIVRDAELADPRVGRRRRHPGHRRLRLRDGQHLQRRPARAGGLRQGRRRAPGRAPRDLRGPAGQDVEHV